MPGILAFAQPRPLAGLAAIWIAITGFLALALGGWPDPVRLASLWGIWLLLNIYATIHNDLCDLDLDRQTQPSKPLVRGAVSERTARWVAWIAAGSGVALSWLIAPLLAVCSLGLIILAFWHDRGAKRSIWSGAPSLLSAGLIPVWAWAGSGSLANGERWIGGALLAIGLFVPVYLLTTVWDFDDTETAGDLAHRIGLRRTLAVSWGWLYLVPLVAVGLTVWLAGTSAILLVALGLHIVLASVSLTLARTRIQLSSIAAGAGATIVLIGWLAAWRTG